MEKFLQKKRRIWAALVAIALFLVVAAPNLAHAQISTLPWTESFTDGTKGAYISRGWSGFSDNIVLTSANAKDYLAESSTGCSAPGVRFGAGYSLGIIATPAFAADVNTLQVSFTLRREATTATATSTFSVGYLTNESDPSSFVTVRHFSIAEACPVEYICYNISNVDLSAIPAGIKKIAFRHETNGTTGTASWIWIDNVTVSTPEPPAPASCTWQVELTDSWGDGWNYGGYLSVYVKGDAVLTNLRLGSGSSSKYDFSVTTGDAVQVVYTVSSGSYPAERGCMVYDAEGNVMANKTEAGSNDFTINLTASCVAPCPSTVVVNRQPLTLTMSQLPYTDPSTGLVITKPSILGTISKLAKANDKGCVASELVIPVTVSDWTGPTIWTGNATYDWYTNSPCASSGVYEIGTAEDLAGFAHIVNGTAPNITRDDFAGKTVKLTKDIYLNTQGDHTNVWMPIANNPTTTKADANVFCEATNYSFNGTFDGQYFVIYNMYVNRLNYMGGAGLFGSIVSKDPNSPVTIKNLLLYKPYVEGHATTNCGPMGCVAGGMWTLTNCHNYITNVQVIDGWVGHGQADYGSGGLVGNVEGRNTCNPQNDKRNLHIENCAFTGNVNKGFTGGWSGGITGNDGSGGNYYINTWFAGEIGENRFARSGSTTTNCYVYRSNGNSSTEGGATQKSEADMKSATFYTTTLYSNTFKADVDGFNGGYPLLAGYGVVSEDGSATCSAPCIISHSNVTASGAKITWEGSTSGSWQLYAAPGNGAADWASADVKTLSATTLSYTYTDLDEATSYTVYLRAACSSTDHSAALTTQFMTPANEVYGDCMWNGYVYDSPTDRTFGTYKGSVTETTKIFTRNPGSGSWSGATVTGTMPADKFTARYRMKCTMDCGYYTFTVGADDNCRLSIDGGETWLVNSNWTGTTTTGTQPVYFNGNTETYFVIEYYENTGSASLSFSYTAVGPPVTVSDITTDEATVTIGGNVGSMWDIWFYKLSTTAIDPATQDGDMLNASTTNATFTLPNLNHSTTYYLYVQSPNCSWTTKTFMTQVLEEYGDGMWNGYVYDMSSTWNWSTFRGIVTNDEEFETNINGNWYGKTSAWVNGAVADNFAVRYLMKKNFPCGIYTFSFSDNVDDDMRFSVDGGQTWIASRGCCGSLISPAVFLGGETYLVLEFHEGGGGARIGFKVNSFSASGPQATATAVGSTTATLTYAGTGDYTLKVSSTALSNPDAENGDVTGFENIIVTTPTIDLGGLIEGGNYYVYAKSRCADESCDAWGTSTFATLSSYITAAQLTASEATAWTKDFYAEKTASGSNTNNNAVVPEGWNMINVNRYHSMDVETATLELNFNSGNTWVIMPPLAADVDMSKLHLKVKLTRRYNQSEVLNVYVTSTSNASDAELVGTLNPDGNNAWCEKTITFSSDYAKRRLCFSPTKDRIDIARFFMWLDEMPAPSGGGGSAVVDSKNVSIPAGTYYTENGFNACETGAYAKYISNTGGDTLVTRNITVNPVTIDTTVCAAWLETGLELYGMVFHEAVTNYVISQPLACNCPNDIIVTITVFDDLVNDPTFDCHEYFCQKAFEDFQLTVTPGTEICEGGTVELSATGTGLTAFLWNTGEATATITTAPVTEETVYTVDVEKGFCTNSYSVTLKPILSPSNLTMTSIGVNSADFAFTPGENNTGWQAVCMTAGKAPDWGAAINLTSPEGSLASLEAATNYTLYLRAGECDYTSIDFKTEGDYANVPALKVDFEDDAENNNWTLGGGDNAWIVGNATGNAGKSLYISNNGQDNEYTSTDAPTWTYATRNIAVTTAGDYYFAYDWKSKGEMEDFDMARVFIISYQPTPLPQGDINTIFSDAAYRSPLLGGVSGWQHVRELVNLQVGNYKIAFLWKNDAGTGFQNPVAIDNVRLDNFTCDAPVALAVNNILAEKADITWNSPGIACEWILAWKEATASAWTETTVAGTSYTLTNLTPSTAYNVRVKSVCATTDETKESAWANKDFSTASEYVSPCAPVAIPYTQNFNENKLLSAICWSGYADNTRLTDATQSTYMGSSSTGCDNTRSIRMYALYDKALLISPEVETDLNKLTATFNLRRENNPNLLVTMSVGYLTNMSDPSSFVALATYGINQMPEENYTCYPQSITLSSVPAGVRHLVFQHATHGTLGTPSWMWVDDVNLSLSAGSAICKKPATLTANPVLSESATITWSKGGTEAEWELQYKKTASTGWTSVSCNTNAQALLNLSPSTSYEVRVRALCSSDNFSDWATASFTTSPACAEPLNLSVIDLSSNATTATATLSWGFGSEASWSVEYKKEADANYTAATVSTNSRTLTNLALNTKYNARVRAICGTNVYSGYVNVSFTTPAASLAEYTITVSVNPVSAGTVSPMGAVKITDGGSKTFAIALDSRYDWTDNTPTGITLTGSSKTGFTVSNVKADAQVVVNAKLKTYTVTATAGANGTIDPAGTTTVNYGEDVLYTITPATGYFVKNVTVDGKDLGSLTQYRFTFANANHTIGATFEKAVTPKTEYTITPEAGANGSISPAVPQQVVAGSYRKFEFVPNEGYKVNEIWIDDTVKLAATMSYTFFNVHSDHKIKVTFIENQGNVDGINDYRAEGTFLLYPNPTSGEITIDNGMSNLKTVGVYDLLGKLHLLVPCEKQAKQTLNVSNLAAGTYLLRVETTEGIYTRKFVKK
jgi:hypothetical protein